jgi:hypothetical protein
MLQTPREKARLASKLAEIREALIAAGYNSAAKQGAVLGLSRSTATVRRKVEEYVVQKICGLYGHNEERTQAFRDELRIQTGKRSPAVQPNTAAGAALHRRAGPRWAIR